MKTLEFIYQETEIHFLVNPTDNNVMINATEMANIFDKRVRNFLRLDETKKWVSKYIEKRNFESSDVSGQIEEKDVFYTTNKATFMHRKLALKFAIWLDVDFELWVMDILDDILFGKEFSKIQKRLTEIELEKENIKKLRNKVLQTNNEDAINLLEAERRLKKLQADNRKGMDSMKSQVRMNLFQ